MASTDAPAGLGVKLEILAISTWTPVGPWLRICVDEREIVYALVDPDVYPSGWQHEHVKNTPRIKIPFFAKEWVGNWNTLQISRSPRGVYFSAATYTKLRETAIYTHMPRYEYLALEKVDLLHKGIRWNYHDRLTIVKSPVGSDGKPIWGVPQALMKIVCFPPELFEALELTKRMEVEIRLHERAAMHGCAPRFIGIVTESGRVIGYLSELLPDSKNFGEIGEELCQEDAEAVTALLTRLHVQAGIVHNDLHSGNILRDANGKVVLIDFEMAITRERCDKPEHFDEYARWERRKFREDSWQWPLTRTLSQ